MALSREQIMTVTMNTTAFTVCFAVWTMFSVIGIPIKENLGLSDTEFGILVATPILTGSLVRLPLGMLTDKFGGRIVYFLLMVFTIFPIWLISVLTSYWALLLCGLFVGLTGGSFSVGIAATARWFDKENQGFAMGIFGAGNAGAAVTKFVAPTLVVVYGWTSVPQVYAAAMTIMAISYWFLTYKEPAHHTAGKSITIKEQLAALKDPTVWKYCQYYSLVFGGFVGVTLWMTKYYVSEYGLGIQVAALMAAIFVLPSGVIRAAGGWLSDRFGAHTVTWWVMWTSLACLFVIAFPDTTVTITTLSGDPIVMNLGVNMWVFTALLFVVGIAWGLGKASVFKYISDEYPDNIGVISGIVGLVGGLGGFLLPILFGILVDVFQFNTVVWWLLFGITLVSLMWMHYTDERATDRRLRAEAEAEGIR
ncbi:MFS transporter [Thiohalomonas denitrificans]|uniref:MFS transporter n=1 Tax=Thiohalomonas denitrificans TaxID=415747 RepID=UPI0026EBA7EE|nr:nitrate/nitrite transporter [Thiohalomonas denitrificans]